MKRKNILGTWQGDYSFRKFAVNNDENSTSTFRFFAQGKNHFGH